VRLIIAIAACIAVLAVAFAPALQMASAVHAAGHHASAKTRHASPRAPRIATTATEPQLPHPLLAGPVLVRDVTGSALDCSQEPFVPPRV
jgi:hypothetical protein